MRSWWHRMRGHRVSVVPDIYGGTRRRAFYCSCEKEWVG